MPSCSESAWGHAKPVCLNCIGGIWPRLDPYHATHDLTKRHIHHFILVAHVPGVQGKGGVDRAALYDVTMIDYIPNELGLRNFSSIFPLVPLVLTAHVPFDLPEVFSGESLM